MQEAQRNVAAASERQAEAVREFLQKDADATPRRPVEPIDVGNRPASSQPWTRPVPRSSSLERPTCRRSLSPYVHRRAATAMWANPSWRSRSFRRPWRLRRQALGPDHPETLLTMEHLARVLKAPGQNSEAESLWRQVLAVRETKMPDDWVTFYARAMLGDALLRQKKFAEAEPLLIAGYEGMKSRESKMDVASPKRFIAEAGSRIIALYDAWGKKDKADEWRMRIGAAKG